MKIKNLVTSLLLSTTIQAGLFLSNNSLSLAMYTSNSDTMYSYETNVIANIGTLTINSCHNGYLSKKIIDDTIREINASKPLLQFLIPRTLILGIDIKEIDINVFNSTYLGNLKTLILPIDSSVIQQISIDKNLQNILTKNDINIK